MLVNQLCLRTMNLDNPNSFSTYECLGGYKIWQEIISKKTDPAQIIEKIKNSGLRGRGGAGFSTGTKWGFIDSKTVGQKYLICNSDEGEPGTFKDRDIMRYNPHQLIEGIAIAAYAMGCSVAYNYIRGEFFEPFNHMEQALKEAYDKKLLGKNILNTGFDLDIYNLSGAGAYICGEETALMNSIEGKKGMPRFKPPFPAAHGIYGRPTTINNTETLASVPMILSNKIKNPGNYKIFCVSGHVNKPGNYEVELGIPFRELLELAGGVKNGKKLKAVIPGGSSSPILPADVIMDLNMDYESIAKAGSMLGSGGVIVMDEDTDMVNLLTRISEFYFEESCGQCTPCREGTGWLARILHKVRNKQHTAIDLDNLERIAHKIMGNTICAFGDAAAMPVLGFIKHFRYEFENGKN